MESAWNAFLRVAPPADHVVQIYRNDAELTASLCAYLTHGFEAGDPSLVIATAERRANLSEALAKNSWDTQTSQEQGLLTFADADETLAKFMEAGNPSLPRFELVVGGLLDSISQPHPGRRVRAFGDMVDVLFRRGQTEAAATVEALWNDMARTRSFSLLCGYGLDIFDRESQVAALPGICSAHTHVRPPGNPERLTLAVDSALEAVLGRGEADKIYLLIDDDARRDQVPGAQLALMWVSEHMPISAERVLAAARADYHSPTPGLPV